MDKTRLRTHLEVKGDRLLVRPEGRLDESTRALFQQALGAAMNPELPLLVDLSRVSYLDSHGARALLEAATRHSHEELELVGNAAIVARVLSLVSDSGYSWYEVKAPSRRPDAPSPLLDLRPSAAAA
ncbi:MAG TPA: STAS domain-containing protein [Armatimonadota bacterium]|jgi:anti-anti-sigma factor